MSQRSRHLIDPQLLPLLELLPTVEITVDNLAQRRARRLAFPVADTSDVSLAIRNIPGAPAVPLYIYRPIGATGTLPAIYHMHGGGFVAGSAAQLEALHRDVVRSLGCVLISVDYRLAPETVFPGALEDCFAGLCWVIEHAAELGVDISRLGLSGESAGGALAAALALMARDRKVQPVAFQHLVYPALDDRTCTRPDPHPYAGEFLWHAPNNRFAWSALLGHEPGLDNVSHYAAPARATDLAGLPPTFLSVGALDLFVEENLEFGRRLMRAGVPVELHVWPGAIHGFDLVPHAHVAVEANRASRAALRRFLWPSAFLERSHTAASPFKDR
jgi:triacylglycerol lipase